MVESKRDSAMTCEWGLDGTICSLMMLILGDKIDIGISSFRSWNVRKKQ